MPAGVVVSGVAYAVLIHYWNGVDLSRRLDRDRDARTDRALAQGVSQERRYCERARGGRQGNGNRVLHRQRILERTRIDR